MENKFGPCLEKKCSWCCNPVKVSRFFPEEKVPKDEQGNKLWQRREKELLISEEHPDTIKLKTYNCEYYDKISGKCLNYEKRPRICRNASCVEPGSKKSVDEQHAQIVNEKFIELSGKKK